METIEEQIERVTAASEQFAPERLGCLDFDAMRALLKSQADLLSRARRDGEELLALRRDLIARIAGMAKAIAAVSRRRDRIRQAAEYVEGLEGVDAAALIAEYRLVSARFREAFPTSFGRLFDGGRRQAGDRFDHRQS